MSCLPPHNPPPYVTIKKMSSEEMSPTLRIKANTHTGCSGVMDGVATLPAVVSSCSGPPPTPRKAHRNRGRLSSSSSLHQLPAASASVQALGIPKSQSAPQLGSPINFGAGGYSKNGANKSCSEANAAKEILSPTFLKDLADLGIDAYTLLRK